MSRTRGRRKNLTERIIKDVEEKRANYNNSQSVAIQSAAYALVKYASQVIPSFDFSVCTKIFKGGVVRVWIERGRNIPENYHKEIIGNPVGDEIEDD